MPSTTANDFSTNQHELLLDRGCIRHPKLCFNDGNLAILASPYYFLVHQGLLARHSPVLDSAIDALSKSQCPRRIEDRPVFQVDHSSPEHVYLFLCALYDGFSNVPCTGSKGDFEALAGILRLATVYQVEHIRQDILEVLSADWPNSLDDWDAREARATDTSSVYRPHEVYPHPMRVITLALDVSAPQLLPSAFYDLSRSMPDEIVQAVMKHDVSHGILIRLLKGKEVASRFLSTFIVNHLEGRTPAPGCIYQNNTIKSLKRACQSAFEAITFEILCDANGVVCQRSCDPLFAITDARMMQKADRDSHKSGCRPCEFCRAEFGAVVDGARVELWRRLPEWFGVELTNWA